MNCAQLESVVLPSTYLGTLGAEAFYNCVKLKSIVIPDGVTAFECYDKTEDGDWTWTSATFKNCTALESVTFGKSLTDLGYYAFENCVSLKEADMSQTNLWALGDYVFKNCTSLESVSLPMDTGYFDFGCDTFVGCINLSGSIDVPYGWMYGGVFKGCTKITEVHIVDGMGEYDNWNYDSEGEK